MAIEVFGIGNQVGVKNGNVLAYYDADTLTVSSDAEANISIFSDGRLGS